MRLSRRWRPRAHFTCPCKPRGRCCPVEHLAQLAVCGVDWRGVCYLRRSNECCGGESRYVFYLCLGSGYGGVRSSPRH